jgi:glycosyltransferase involved in cell wall biosynthesis
VTHSRPLVSVVIPVYGGEAFVDATIRSVLAQTYRPTEIIAVDDGSPDGSAAILRSFPQVNYRHQRNLGVAAARNHGVRVATGDFLAFVDQDDLWLPRKIDVQMQLLEAHPSAGGVLTEQIRFLEPGMAVPAWVRPGTLGLPLRAPDLSALLLRRSVFDEVGAFDESLIQTSDSDWFFRAKDRGVRIEWAPDVLVHRRVHTSNNSRFSALSTSEIRRVALDSIRRRRNEASQ